VDMKYFLKAIYMNTFFSPGKKTLFPIVAAVLRLSTKYRCHALRRRAIDCLLSAYPLSLDHWFKRSHRRLFPPFQGEISDVLALAAEVDVPCILPAAFYAACQRPLSEVLEEILNNPKIGSHSMYMKFVVGREKLRHFEVEHVLAFLHSSFQRPDCQNGYDDNTLKTVAQNTLLKTTEYPPYQQSFIDDPTQAANSLIVCEECRRRIENTVKVSRTKMWEELPAIFDLPQWETLKSLGDVQDDEDNLAE